MTANGYFVTGTDTGVGKTLVASALLLKMRDHGLSAVGMKPVAAGTIETPHGRSNEDVDVLALASSVQAPASLVNPYRFDEPVAPHIAAADAGVCIDLHHIRHCFQWLAEQVDAVVVEGAGGLLVPLGPGHDTRDLAVSLGLPVILVVGMRLGCINHALLTTEAISARGLTLAGWVANRIDPTMRRFEENLQALGERIGARMLGVVPHMSPPDPRRAAEALRLPESL